MHIGAAGRCSEAWFKNGFIYRDLWEHLCRRCVHSTKCLLVIIIIIIAKGSQKYEIQKLL